MMYPYGIGYVIERVVFEHLIVLLTLKLLLSMFEKRKIIESKIYFMQIKHHVA